MRLSPCADGGGLHEMRWYGFKAWVWERDIHPPRGRRLVGVQTHDAPHKGLHLHYLGIEHWGMGLITQWHGACRHPPFTPMHNAPRGVVRLYAYEDATMLRMADADREREWSMDARSRE
jgi:hypothetical protein